MDPYKVTFETWNKVAKLYEENFMELSIYNESYDLFCHQISASDPTIFEIGCGPGNITQYLLQKIPNLNIDAIDIAPSMVALAQKNNPKAIVWIQDSREIDSVNSKYNAVVCGFCIPYLSQSDVSKLIFNCSNLLLDGGCIYLSFVEGDYLNSGYQTSSSGDKAYFYFHDLANIISILDNNGFNIINQLVAFYDRKNGEKEKHTILIAKK